MTDDDEGEALLRDAVMLFGGLVFCETCMTEACPDAPLYTDDAYAAAARRLWADGWRTRDALHVYCPGCAATGTAPPAREASPAGAGG